MKLKPVLLVLLVLQLISCFSADILFGQSSNLNGPDGTFSGVHMGNGIKAAFEEINAKGGFNNQLVNLIQINDNYTAFLADQNCRSLIQNYNVTALIGNFGTAASAAAFAVAKELKTLMIAPASGGDQLRSVFSPYIAHVRPSYFAETSAMINYFVNSRRKRRLAIFSQNDTFGWSTQAGIIESLAVFGLTPVSIGVVEVNQVGAPMMAAADKVAPGKPEVIFVLTTPAVQAAFMDYVKSSPAKFPNAAEILFSFVSMSDPFGVANRMTTNVDNIYYTSPYPSPFDTSYELIRRYQTSLKKLNSALPFNYYNLEGYVSGLLAVEMLRAAYPAVSSDAMIEALYAKRTYWLEDMSLGPYTRNCSGSSVANCFVCNQGVKYIHMMQIKSKTEVVELKENYFSWRDSCTPIPAELALNAPIVFAYGVESKNDPEAIKYLEAANNYLNTKQSLFGKPIFMKMYEVADLLQDSTFLIKEAISGFFGTRFLSIGSEMSKSSKVKSIVSGMSIPYYSTSFYFQADDITSFTTPYFYKMVHSHYDQLIAILSDAFNRRQEKRIDFILENSELGLYYYGLLNIMKIAFLDRSSLVGSYDLDIRISICPTYPSELERLDFFTPIIKSDVGVIVVLGETSWVASSITSCFYLPEGRKHTYYTICSDRCDVNAFVTGLHPIAASSVYFAGLLPLVDESKGPQVLQFNNGTCTSPNECMGDAMGRFIVAQLSSMSRDAVTAKDFNEKTLTTSIFSIYGHSVGPFTATCHNGGHTVTLHNFVDDNRKIKFIHTDPFIFSECLTTTHESDSVLYPAVIAAPPDNAQNKDYLLGFKLGLDFMSRTSKRKYSLTRTDGTFENLASLRKKVNIFAYVGHTEFDETIVNSKIPLDTVVIPLSGNYILKKPFKRSILNLRPTMDDEIYAIMKWLALTSRTRIAVVYDKDSQLFRDAKEKGLDNYFNYEMGLTGFPVIDTFLKPNKLFAVPIQEFFTRENEYTNTISQYNVLFVLANSNSAAQVLARIEYLTNQQNNLLYAVPSEISTGYAFNFQDFLTIFNSTVIGGNLFQPKTSSIVNGTVVISATDGSYIFDKIVTTSAFASTDMLTAPTGTLVGIISYALSTLRASGSSTAAQVKDVTPALVEGFFAGEFIYSTIGSTPPSAYLGDVYGKSVHEIEDLTVGPLGDDCSIGVRSLIISKYYPKIKATKSVGVDGLIEFPGCGFVPNIPSLITWVSVLFLNLMIWPIVVLILCCCFACCTTIAVTFFITKRTLYLLDAPKGRKNIYCFTDIESSTKLWSMDAKGMRQALRIHNQVMRALIKKCNGYEVKTQGDSFFIVFKQPLDALYFAMNLQFAMMHPKKIIKKRFCCSCPKSCNFTPDALISCLFTRNTRDYSQKLLSLTKTEKLNNEDNINENANNKGKGKDLNSRRDSISSHHSSSSRQSSGSRHHEHHSIFRGLRVRIGLHVGDSTRTLDPVSSRYDFFGNDVNKGARIQHLACGGQILISQEFFALLNRTRAKLPKGTSAAQMFGNGENNNINAVAPMNASGDGKIHGLQLLVPLTHEDEVIIQKTPLPNSTSTNALDRMMSSASDSESGADMSAGFQETSSSKRGEGVPPALQNASSRMTSEKSLTSFFKKYNTAEQKKSMQIMKLTPKQKQKISKLNLASKKVLNRKFEQEIGKIRFFYRKIGYFSFKGIAETSLVIEAVHPMLVQRCQYFNNEEGDDGKAHAADKPQNQPQQPAMEQKQPFDNAPKPSRHASKRNSKGLAAEFGDKDLQPLNEYNVDNVLSSSSNAMKDNVTSPQIESSDPSPNPLGNQSPGKGWDKEMKDLVFTHENTRDEDEEDEGRSNSFLIERNSPHPVDNDPFLADSPATKILREKRVNSPSAILSISTNRGRTVSSGRVLPAD